MILVIDNYDSFTWNLVQYLAELGAEPVVHRSDRLSVEAAEALSPAAIVVSPGPGTPADAGISVDLIRRLGPRTPVLGVCLGHQAVAVAFGGRIVRARRTLHGRTSPVAHAGEDLFSGIPSPFTVARYHSLVVDPDLLPEELAVLARTDEAGFTDEIQAVRHRVHPIWGLQFHPESIASEHGHTLLRNFLERI